MIISLSLLRVSLLWTNCDYFSSTAFGAKGQTPKNQYRPTRIISGFMLFVENVRTCRMLYVMMGLRVPDCTRASRTESLDSLRCVKVCLGRIGFCASTHVSRACVRNGLQVHTCWVNVYILQLQISVFFSFSSKTSSKDIALCTPFYGCWRTWKAHISAAYECWCDEKEGKAGSKACRRKCFAWGVLAWDSVCIRGGVFPGRCMCVLNSVCACVCVFLFVCVCGDEYASVFV